MTQQQTGNDQLIIRCLNGPVEAEVCARMMSSTEPWLTFGKSYEQALVIMNDPDLEVYIATEGDGPLGFIVLALKGAFVGYVRTLCVRSESRSKGIGKRLLSFGEERIFQESPNAFICVSSFNHQASELYLRLGYEVVGVLKDYVIAGSNEILMRKSIASISEFNRKPS